jgi:hypothetical protein
MKVVFVGFNINNERAVCYSKFKTKDGAVRAFRRYLENPEVQFFSIRKVDGNTD